MNGFQLIKNCIRRYRHHRRLFHELHRAFEEIQAFSTDEQALGVIRTTTKEILQQRTTSLVKGAPDVSAIKRRLAEPLLSVVDGATAAEDYLAAVKLARELAQIEVNDFRAFRCFLAAFLLANRKAIDSLRNAAPQGYVVLHMTCRPRIERARLSASSFVASTGSRQLLHVLLVGDGSRMHFDQDSGVLEVTSSDTYEHLPSKMIESLAFVGIGLKNATILKLDDDHRAISSDLVLDRLAEVRRQQSAVQEGTLYTTPLPSAHSRVWHYDKCRDGSRGRSPVTYPSPSAWITGEHGYILNSGAMRLYTWAHVHYASWISQITYEDVALGEIAEKLGIRQIDRPLRGTCIDSVNAY